MRQKVLVAVVGHAIFAASICLCVGPALGHGNVTPTPFPTPGLPDLGTEWKKTDPFLGNAQAIEIGANGFYQNCAACHGLDMEAGPMAPDLRGLPTGAEGDEIFVDRVKNGYIHDGMTKMPKYADVLSQTALWAIRAYIEANHKDGE